MATFTLPLLLLATSSTGAISTEAGRNLLPPVFSIPRNTTARLDVDVFFSLFFVFLNDNVEETSGDFTVLAPAGLTTEEAASWLAAEEPLTEQLLRNHIVLGEHLRPELVVAEPGPWTTLGGEQVTLKVDNNGEFRVNGVRVLAWTREGSALIVVLEDYLFRAKVAEELVEEEEEEEEEEVVVRIHELADEFPQAKPRKAGRNCTKVGSKAGGLAIFRQVTICTETVEAASPTTRRLDGSTLLHQVASTAAALEADHGPTLQQFLAYADQVGVESVLSSKEAWTVLAPVDSAWMRWTPIDWGFNPFLVETFLNTTMAGLFVRGLVEMEGGGSWTTLAGNRVEVTSKGENLFIGGSLVLGWRQLEGGRLVLVEQVPGVTAAMVDQLEADHPHLISSPPLPPIVAPEEWQQVEQAPLLPSLLATLSATPDTGAMADFLRATPDLASRLQPGGAYTLLVPTDEAFLDLCREASDPCGALAQEPALRLALLLDHLVPGLPQLEGSPLTHMVTMGGTNLTLIHEADGSHILSTGDQDAGAIHLISEQLAGELAGIFLIGGVIKSTIQRGLLPQNPQGHVVMEDGGVAETDMKLKLEDELLTLDMVALLGEDQVNFPENEETTEKNEIEEKESQEVWTVSMPEEDINALPFLGNPDPEQFVREPSHDKFLVTFQNSPAPHLLNKLKSVRKVEEKVENEKKSSKTRVVYINNQRLEISQEPQ